jgi:hypothetical protein
VGKRNGDPVPQQLPTPEYAKDYDAIVTLALGGRQLFALEYERTPKAQTEYDRIVSCLA